MRIRTARRFKAIVTVAKAGEDIVAVWKAQSLIRSPASSRETLCFEIAKCVSGSAEMFPAAQGEIGLHCRAECVDMAVRMSSIEIAFAFGQQIKIFVV